ncbi:C40 family peptidase [Actinocorallia longicatena]|uniref:C40 family peptidase n=1 Tax=Actinocorallia longicatena TaxID=111803 RepID=A0ABP6QLV1_9ACTN
MKHVRSRLLCAALAVAVAFPGAAHADPDPMKQIEKIADDLEQINEQLNGLTVKLKQAKRAAKVAQENADRQQKNLDAVSERVSGLAASTYMMGGADQTVAFATARDPQTFLDQTATLSYFAAQDGTKVLALVNAMQSAQRTKKAADERAREVVKLTGDLKAKKKTLDDEYSKIRDKIVKKDPEKIKNIPLVEGSGKAAEALRFAMKQLGKPYVWGADGPNSFDCSGLTMWAYAQVGINLPHFTGSQWNAGTHVNRDQLQPGDLVFFYSDLHHVGMYVGNGMMLHAPQTGDVVKIAPMGNRPFAGGVRIA